MLFGVVAITKHLWDCLRAGLKGLAIWGLLGAFQVTHAAQVWAPKNPIEIVVPTTPGGTTDATARLVQKILQENGLVKVPVTVVNRPGGGGVVSIAYLNQHGGDGHYVSVNTPNVIANDLTGRSPIRYTEITALANFSTEHTAVAVRADSPIRTGQDFVDRLRRDPGSLAVSTPTTLGSINHMAFGLLAKAAGVDVRKLKAVVLGSGGGDAVTTLLGGHIDAHIGTAASVARMVEAGKIRVIAIAASRRMSGLYADVPTWTEQGYPVVMSTWRGLIGPRGMTREQIAFWDDALSRVAATDTWKKAAEAGNWESNYLNSNETRKLFDSNYAEYRSILTDLGMIKGK